MRYENSEMYNTSHTLTKLLFDVQIAFWNSYNIGAIGPRDPYPTQTMFGILIVDRLFLTGMFFYTLLYSLHVTTDSFKKIYKAYLVLHTIVMISVGTIYLHSNKMEGQSLIVDVWVRFILVETAVDFLS
jgi:hypothetical protein